MILIPVLFVACLCAGMVALLEFGRRTGARGMDVDPTGSRNGLGAVEGAIFGLMGLMLAFTFSGAASRFEARRELINQETNDIGTAWLRLDLLPAEARSALRQHFRDYLDERIALYRVLPDLKAAAVAKGKASALQEKIWGQAIAACQPPTPPSTVSLVLSALNTMFDIATTRESARHNHPPMVIFALLLVMTLGCSLLIGDGMAGSKTRNWLYQLAFAIIVSTTVYVIIDLEFPRFGLIRVDAADQPLLDLRASMDKN